VNEPSRRSESPDRSIPSTLPLTENSPEAREAASTSPGDTLSRLAEFRQAKPRYEEKGEIAKGGMGVILKVWDSVLRRVLAMKIIRDADGAPPGGGDSPAVDERDLARFLEEAQVTAQLDHPGIVPVHELGIDPLGRVFFSMKLVKGRDLRTILDLVFAEKEDWNETRAIGVILKVCEAMAYAHAKGVIHRDLKPGNVMVGSFGEVFVMDWGLARVEGKRDTKDLRLRAEDVALSSLKTDRRRERETNPDSPIITMGGTIVGTPAYMPPEQSLGAIEKLGPRSDVYAIGAMLYHLLARQMPYVPPGARLSVRAILEKVQLGPPTPLCDIRKDVPPELAAIVEKAMQRDIERRYAGTMALADDLRAYLERRVVKAYETGAVAELKKWVERNKPLAATIAATLLILVVSLFVINGARLRADENAIEANRQKEEVLRLADVRRLQDLEVDATRFWPAYAENDTAIEEWLRRAKLLVEHLPAHEDRLREIRTQALPEPEREEHPRSLAAEVALGYLDDGEATSSTARFESTTMAWQHGVMTDLVDGVRALASDEVGWTATTIRSLDRRLEFSRNVRQRTVDDQERAWREAVEAVRTSAVYSGLELTPEIGLVPIGADPLSGLYEFWHFQSGERPKRGPDGRIVRDEAMGIVLVLIPGGTFAMGSREEDQFAEVDELPFRERVSIDAFFLSKYEMTQRQWLRFAGENPSGLRTETQQVRITLEHPVERMNWEEAVRLLFQMDLFLPTEAQWEYAARAGQPGLWWTGNDPSEIRKAENQDRIDPPDTADGDVWELHAPVGSRRPNPFGLYDVLGNVFELCMDAFCSYEEPPRPGDGLRPTTGRPSMVVRRGGSWSESAKICRIANRDKLSPTSRYPNTGIRPARPLHHRPASSPR